MGMISVPVDAELEQKIKYLIARGYSETKAGVFRKALKKAAEDEAVEAVLRSERAAAAGKVFRGDLDKLAKKLKY